MILLSFDIEEFDVPCEHGVDMPMSEQVRISTEGTHAVLDCLRRTGVQATFFCTANFADHAPHVVRRILDEGHELASHGYYHSRFEPADLMRSRQRLEDLAGVPVVGYRQARMMPVPEDEVRRAGYRYNSSINPTLLPGRYCNLHEPRRYFVRQGVVQLPASVTPLVRFPLFWLSCHNLPFRLYRWLCDRTLAADGYLVVYFHPWEFYPLEQHPELRLPRIIRRHSGPAMLARLTRWIEHFRQQGRSFITHRDFVAQLNLVQL